MSEPTAGSASIYRTDAIAILVEHELPQLALEERESCVLSWWHIAHDAGVGARQLREVWRGGGEV